MASQARMELGKIKRASTILQKKLYSTDPDVAEKAEAQLDEIAKSLRAWARKYRVKLKRHVETGPAGEARRRRKCAGIIDISGSDPKTCFLIGKQGRNCLYDCIPGIISGLEF